MRFLIKLLAMGLCAIPAYLLYKLFDAPLWATMMFMWLLWDNVFLYLKIREL